MPDGTREQTCLLSTTLTDNGRIITVSGPTNHWLISWSGDPEVQLLDLKGEALDRDEVLKQAK